MRIVGIGASAGGLMALEQFLAHVPPNSGMAYIVVQHLDPTQKALLPELLQRVTAMPVREAEQRAPIEPDCVYVIPPNAELSVSDHVLSLAKPTEPRGMRLPVNVLFSSLAAAHGERTIAVILSGMGSDGTLGMQAIKAMGGLTVVQDPASSQFDSMPKSAIAAGCGDIVAPAEELPARILAYVNNVPYQEAPAVDEGQPVSVDSALQKIMKLLRRHTRHDFSLYKASGMQRRIARRMAIHNIASPSLYAQFLEQNTQEIHLLFNELLIGVTSFFRDPAVWDYLAETALPELLAKRTELHTLRAWSVGCSTGEEAYSLAMVFSEAADRMPAPYDLNLQIFASDLSTEAIAAARRGQYPRSISDDVSAARLKRFFSSHENHYQINQKIRDMVLFAQHDVVLDPPFTKLDLIACRNLLIYFDPILQRRLLPLFHYSLRFGGLLLLGNSETSGRFKDLFEAVEPKLRLYLRQDSGADSGRDLLDKTFPPLSGISKELPVSSPQKPAQTPENLQIAADRILLQVYAPAAVLLNSNGDIVYISGHTGKYLEPAAGKADWNFHAMVREGLRASVFSALTKSAKTNEPLQLHGLKVPIPGGVQHVDVAVQTFQQPGTLHGMSLVVFRDVAVTPAGRGRRKLQDEKQAPYAAELQQCRDEIQLLNEQMRVSGEELQSANEELQSTNEELQSTNEELTSSKEEMQSMNEELQTINTELQTKLDDLALAQSDMQNVLNSIEIAIVFLDQKLNVRRFTDRAAKIVSLRESDVGRPLSDLTTSLEYPELRDDALETLRTLMPMEKQILATDGRWFTVRIMPYRRLDNMIVGVVITLVDITETKQLESALRKDQKKGDEAH